MNKKKVFGIFCMFAMLIMENAFGDNLILVADEWCPYNCNPRSEHKGYMVDLATQILGEAGHTVIYKALNWSRSVIKSREGKYHGVIAASKSEAADFIFTKESLGLVSNHYWVKKGDPWRFNGINSLKKRWLGIIQDYDYGKELNNYIKKNKATFSVQVSTGDDALDVIIRKLEHSRINTFNEDKNVFLYKLKTLNKTNLFEDAGHDMTSLDENYIYIAFSPFYVKKSFKYAKIMDEGIKRYRRNGKLQKILSTYGLTDWK